MVGYFIVKHPYIFMGSIVIACYATYRAVSSICDKFKNVDSITINLNKKEKTSEEK